MMPPGLGVVEDGLIAARGGKILFAGPACEAPAFEGQATDCEGRWALPGFIDCHTHLVYGGDRSGEYEARLAGKSYAAIAREGGGIRATMRATRQMSEQELVQAALPRLDAMIDEGLTTVEVKSGYGLSLADEIKQLRAANALSAMRPVSVTATLLAAHAVPPEFEGDADGYIDEICEKMLPAVAREKLAYAVDGFCETIGFSPAQIARLFEAAKAQGFRLKLHAEQLSDRKGASVAAKWGALSADHLEYLDEEGASAMKKAGTVAVLLPGAFYFMRETQKPPVELLRKKAVPIAVATDCNPGTSPLTSPLLAMNMAAVLFGLTARECLLGMTREAARALGRLDRVGTLETGKDCDIAFWNIGKPEELVYGMGLNPLWQRIWRGR